MTPTTMTQTSRLPRWIGLVVLVAAALSSTLMLTNCQNTGTSDTVTSIKIADHVFTLELAITPETRFKGLSDREFIADDGGMIFVFTRPSLQSFVMRDCPIDIDILYLDANGRVLTTHAMVAEEPRSEGESDIEYNGRLRKYSSRFSNVQFVIELKGGKIAEIGVKEGDQLDIDADRLKALAS